MKSIFVQAGKTALPIILSGVAAAGIAFLQSLAHSAGACPAPTVSVEQVSILGALFKSMHSVIEYGVKVNQPLA